jgi:STE24 endopeptidase
MSRTGGALPAPPASPAAATALFAGGFALIVLIMGVWSRVLARHVTGENLHRSLRRFTRAMYVARLLIPAWFAAGVFALGWSHVVGKILGLVDRWPVELPGALLGTLPALLAWMGLWWAQYPADRALREQGMLINLDENLPINSPPGFWSYFTSSLRLQVLFTLVPVAMILLLRDITCTVLWKAGVLDVATSTAGANVDLPGNIEMIVSLAALLIVFVTAPEILRRVLRTEPLPPSALRNRLEAMCRRCGLKYREILLWHTDHNMGNAAVMGIVPRVRYILLSDLLLETMTDQQIEAVFAHEVGHVVHRHMAWYAVFLVIILGALIGPGHWISDHFDRLVRQGSFSVLINLGTVLASCGGFFMLFGALSRWFERQADVYAARTMQGCEQVHLSQQDTQRSLIAYEPNSYVGPYGAELFVSALHRVAIINNIPLDSSRRYATRGTQGSVVHRLGGVIDFLVEQANNWFHGSIPTRMAYLRSLSADPARTNQFDRTMSVVYATLLVGLFMCGTFFAVVAIV